MGNCAAVCCTIPDTGFLVFLSAIADILKISPNDFVEFSGLLHLLAQLSCQTRHLILERLAVFFNIGRADIATRGKDMAVSADLVERSGFAETGYVLVSREAALFFKHRVCFSASNIALCSPRVIGIGNLFNIIIGQFTMNAVNHCAKFAGVDEEHMPPPVTEAPSSYRSNEPEADGDLCRIELTGHGDHTINPTGLGDVLADLPFAGLVDDIEPLARTKPAIPVGAR